MVAEPAAVQPEDSVLGAWLAGCCLVLTAKSWQVCAYGNSTPSWNQWDSQEADLYKPLLAGTLHFTDLFAARNEHRIFFTRPVLSLLEANGRWIPLLAMCVEAVLHVLVVLTLPILRGRSTSQRIGPPDAAGGTLVIRCIPESIFIRLKL